MRTLAALLLVLLVGPGCYHATVVTGKPAGTTVVERPFALGFVYGLIPPPTLSVAQECPQGVAQVETQMSFVNGLVNTLTFGLVNPWTITVTCASGSASLDQPTVDVAAAATVEDIQTAFAEAADQTVETGETIYVRFE